LGLNDALIYREGGKADLEALKRLCLISYGQHQEAITTENWQQWEETFLDDFTYLNLLKIGKCFVCEHENTVVGMAFFIPHGNPFRFFDAEWSYIRLVGVYPEYQGNGIAKKLTQMCMEMAKETGEKILSLHTSEFQNAARHIYEKLGFVKYKNLGPFFGKEYYLYVMEL